MPAGAMLEGGADGSKQITVPQDALPNVKAGDMLKVVGVEGGNVMLELTAGQEDESGEWAKAAKEAVPMEE